MNTPVSPKCPARRARRGGWAIVLGENSGRGVQLILSDVRVAGHRGQVCVPEILGDQARVACGLAQPRRRRVAQCVCAVTCLSMPARVAVRWMIPARIVG